MLKKQLRRLTPSTGYFQTTCRRMRPKESWPSFATSAGARTGARRVALGLRKMGRGILFGSAAGGVPAALPASLLGVLLAFAGLELGLAARDASGRNPFFVASATAEKNFA